MKKFLFFALCSLLFALSLSGCPKKPLVKPPVTKPEEEVKPPPVIEEIPEEVKVIEPEIREKDFQIIPELKTVYFDFDKYDLLPETQAVLQNNTTFLKKNPDLNVLVEGHCCECGTIEYNLGLGDKRAKTVRDYYIQLGITPGRIATISYGEEKPVYPNVCPPDSPLGAKNRRVETKVLVEKKAQK